MPVETHFVLVTRHETLAADTPLPVEIEPDAPTRDHMARHGLRWRAQGAGGRVHGVPGAPSLELDRDAMLRFLVIVANPRFVATTRWPRAEAGGPVVFTNRADSVSANGWTDADLEPFVDRSARLPARAALAIEISMPGTSRLRSAAARPPVFTLRFAATRAHWCYFLLTNRPEALAAFRIDAEPGATADEAPVFGAATTRELDAADTDLDTVGARIRAEAPSGTRVIRFTSTAAVPAAQPSPPKLQLFAGATRLYTALPVPAPTDLTSVRIQGESRPACWAVVGFPSI